MSKKLLKRKSFSKVIDEMVKIDQSARKNALNKKVEDQIFYNHLVYLIDFTNGQRIKDLIQRFGYPTQETVGKQSMKNFWLLIQHQDFNLDLQQDCLDNCDFEPRNKAYLTDRVLINLGKKQLYGTQFHKNEKGELVPQPIENEINVDKRRREMGLESLAEYAEKIQEINKK
ncbi:MAG: DUF6624 domain-containing protein [Patescibacteria group bacterium]